METTDKIAEILSGVKYYAHRGCYNGKRPENSVAAIKVAADNGLGLEIDVHLTKDGRLVVFHDHTLRRMCKRKGVIEEMTLDEITACGLNGTEHKIPALEDVLYAVGGRVPILIELKCRNNETALCDALIDVLSAYSGKYMYIGFNEKAAAYLKSKGYTVALSCFRPKVPSMDFKPDVLLCNIAGIPRSQKRRNKYPPFVSWTVETGIGKRKSEKACVATIFNARRFGYK